MNTDDNVVDIENEKETQRRVDKAIILAKAGFNEMRRQCKIAKAQGEKHPHMLEQMALAYANALSHYDTYKTLKDDGYSWEAACENAHELLRITLSHIEQRFIKNEEDESKIHVNH